MFANVTNKRLIFNIPIANTAQYKNPIKKWAEDLNKHFSKKMAKRHKKLILEP